MATCCDRLCIFRDGHSITVSCCVYQATCLFSYQFLSSSLKTRSFFLFFFGLVMLSKCFSVYTYFSSFNFLWCSCSSKLFLLTFFNILFDIVVIPLTEMGVNSVLFLKVRLKQSHEHFYFPRLRNFFHYSKKVQWHFFPLAVCTLKSGLS